MQDVRRHLVSTRFGQIHLRESGEGPAVVLLHINQQSSAMYLELMEALGGRFRAVAIDYPSHGMSDPIAFQPSISDYAECALAALDALGIRSAFALGEATGAAVAVELGSTHADRVPAIVLLNCPIYRSAAQAHEVHGQLKSGVRPADPSGFPLTRTIDFMLEVDPGHSPLRPDQSWMDRLNRAQIECGRNRWQALDALNAYDVTSNLSRIRAEALLLLGEHFHYVPRIDEYRARIPKLEAAEIVPDARFCMGWERAEIIAERMKRFLEPRLGLLDQTQQPQDM